jgi:hypothetical protein
MEQFLPDNQLINIASDIVFHKLSIKKEVFQLCAEVMKWESINFAREKFHERSYVCDAKIDV